MVQRAPGPSKQHRSWALLLPRAHSGEHSEGHYCCLTPGLVLQAQPCRAKAPYQLLRCHQLQEFLDEVTQALDGPGALHSPLLGLHNGGVTHGLQQDVNWERNSVNGG